MIDDYEQDQLDTLSLSLSLFPDVRAASRPGVRRPEHDAVRGERRRRDRGRRAGRTTIPPRMLLSRKRKRVLPAHSLS